MRKSVGRTLRGSMAIVIAAAGMMSFAALSASAQNVVCQEAPILAIADSSGDGIVTIAEIRAVAPDNESLQDVASRAEAQGITGIQYQGCDDPGAGSGGGGTADGTGGGGTADGTADGTGNGGGTGGGTADGTADGTGNGGGTGGGTAGGTGNGGGTAGGTGNGSGGTGTAGGTGDGTADGTAAGAVDGGEADGTTDGVAAAGGADGAADGDGVAASVDSTVTQLPSVGVGTTSSQGLPVALMAGAMGLLTLAAGFVWRQRLTA